MAAENHSTASRIVSRKSNKKKKPSLLLKISIDHELLVNACMLCETVVTIFSIMFAKAFA